MAARRCLVGKSPAPITGDRPSVQDACTPREFLDAVEAKFGTKLIHDLAATHENAVCASYFTRLDCPLAPETVWPATRWHPKEALWLNPPFADIGPWVERALLESNRSRSIFVLVPASTDTKWYRDFVHNQCGIYWLSPRIKFKSDSNPKGEPYPKPLMLLDYSWRVRRCEQWQWWPEGRSR